MQYFNLFFSLLLCSLIRMLNRNEIEILTFFIYLRKVTVSLIAFTNYIGASDSDLLFRRRPLSSSEQHLRLHIGQRSKCYPPRRRTHMHVENTKRSIYLFIPFRKSRFVFIPKNDVAHTFIINARQHIGRTA